MANFATDRSFQSVPPAPPMLQQDQQYGGQGGQDFYRQDSYGHEMHGSGYGGNSTEVADALQKSASEHKPTRGQEQGTAPDQQPAWKTSGAENS